MPKKIKLFLVGASRPVRGEFLNGIKTSPAPEKPRGVEFIVHQFDTFECLPEYAVQHLDLDLVVLINLDPMSAEEVAEMFDGLDRLAPALAKHPNHPMVYLLDKRTQPLQHNNPFKDVGVRMIADEPTEFWKFVMERIALKQKREEIPAT